MPASQNLETPGTNGGWTGILDYIVVVLRSQVLGIRRISSGTCWTIPCDHYVSSRAKFVQTNRDDASMQTCFRVDVYVAIKLEVHVSYSLNS